jgi:hypothetical protein
MKLHVKWYHFRSLVPKDAWDNFFSKDTLHFSKTQRYTFQRQRRCTKDKDDPKTYQRWNLWEKMSKMSIPKTKTPKTNWTFSWCTIEGYLCYNRWSGRKRVLCKLWAIRVVWLGRLVNSNSRTFWSWARSERCGSGKGGYITETLHMDGINHFTSAAA